MSSFESKVKEALANPLNQGELENADAVGTAAILSEFLFKAGDFRAEDELGVLQDILDGRIDFGLNRVILAFQIDKWNHRCSG